MTKDGWHFHDTGHVSTALAYQWQNMIEVVDHAAYFLTVPESWLAVLRQAPDVSLVTGGKDAFYVDMLYTTFGNKVEEPQTSITEPRFQVNALFLCHLLERSATFSIQSFCN